MKIKTIWDFTLLFLSLYVMVILALDITGIFSTETEHTLNIIDTFICGAFFVDYILGFKKSEDKWTYVKYNILELLSCIPLGNYFRAFRIFKITKMLRFLRVFRTFKLIKDLHTKHKLIGVTLIYIIALFLLMLYLSVAVYMLEKDINNNINSVFDSFWWSFNTVTSVGYGDVYPITTCGRLLSMLLTICGLGLFSLITANVCTSFTNLFEKEQ